MPKNKGLLLVVCFLIVTSITNFSMAENLYNEATYQSLVADKKAFKIGDSLTILVVEAAKAESRAGTGSEMGTNMRAGVSDSVSTHNVGLGIGSSSGGDAVTSRHGFLSAQLAVTVMAIDNNDLFDVSGEQTIIINGEEQKIVITGKVRRMDISKNNTILSNRLTNAKIEFSGDGVVGEAQDTGIFYKVFQWLGLV